MASFRHILGIQSFSSHDSAAAVVRFSEDGEMLDYVAISEERLIRIKYPYVFPVHAIGYCMEHFGLESLDQIDLLMTDWIRLERWFNSGPAYNIADFDYLKMKFNFPVSKIRSIRHHLAHAASTYYASDFDEAAVLIVDGNGSDLETTTYYKAEGQTIAPLENYQYHGIGAAYNAVTTHILNMGTGGEGKTMGLAPYGEPHPKVLDIGAKLDGIENNLSTFMRRMPYSDVLNQIDANNRINPLRGQYRKCEDKKNLLDPYFARCAFDIQEETERVLVHLGNDLYEKCPSKNLCIAGGVGLNSVANKIVLDNTPFKNIFIFPACSDAGIPLGLALFGYYNAPEFAEQKKRQFTFTNAYTGKTYKSQSIRDMLEHYGVPFTESSLKETAQSIADGQIVGWFQGGSEYGPRALGHRSILADSRKAEMKDILNERVKHRESFRPFAPSILAEHASEYFELDCPSPYMLLIAKVKKPDVVPSITHVDGTARVQTVTQESNGIYYDLIKAFGEITGVPCVLNTSFNDAGEPIVETPEDAVISFLKTDMDTLVLGEEMLRIDASALPPRGPIIEKMEADRAARIADRRQQLVEKHFPGYSETERDNFVAESNEMSAWHAKYRSKYELEKKVMEWNANGSKVLVIGTEQHTALLPQYINGFATVNVVGFVRFDSPAEVEGGDVPDFPYTDFALEDIANLDYDEVLVSSFEHNFEIEKMLKEKGVTKPVYVIYDNASRGFEDVIMEFPAFAQ